jgi:large subunit ribosomal protein L9
MDVILLERIEKLGQMGDIVKVKPGFARNYLLPQKKALRATKDNMAVYEQQRAQLEADNLQRRSEAEAVAGKVDGLAVVLIRQAGDTGQLYGSVTSRDLAQSVTEAGATITRGQIKLERPIKMLGLHPVTVFLHPEVSITVTANVARSEAEAEAQAKSGHIVTEEEQEATVEAAEAEILEEIAETEAEEAAEAEAEETGDAEASEETKEAP